MTKSNRKKRKRRRSSTSKGSRPLPQQKTPKESPQRNLKQWISTPLRRIEFSLSLFFGILAIGGLIFDLFREPEVHVQPVQTIAPFEVFFSLHNPSYVFDNKSVKVNCIVKEMHSIKPKSFINIENSTFVFALPESIQPKEKRLAKCPVNTLASTGEVTKSFVTMTVEFETLWWRRVTKEYWFNWNPYTHQWSEGRILGQTKEITN